MFENSISQFVMNRQLVRHIGVWLSNKELAEAMMASRVLLDPFEDILVKRETNKKVAIPTIKNSAYLLFSLDSQFFYSIGVNWFGESRLNIWNVQDLSFQASMTVLKPTTNWLTYVFATKDGIITNVNERVLWFSIKEKREILYGMPATINWMYYSPLSNAVIIYDITSRLRWFQCDQVPPTQVNFLQLNGRIRRHTFSVSNNEKMIAIADEHNKIHIIHFDKSQSITIQRPYPCLSICFSNDDHYVTFLLSFSYIEIFDIHNNTSVRYAQLYDTANNSLHNILSMRNGFDNIIYAISSTSIFKMNFFDPEEYEIEGRDGVIEILFSPNKKHRLHVYHDKIQVYTHKTNTQFTITCNIQQQNQVLFSPDGQLIFILDGTFSCRNFQVWHLECKTCLYKTEP